MTQAQEPGGQQAASVESVATTGAVLGIDVGFSPTRRSSAVCRLDWTDRGVTWTIERFRAAEPERTGTIRRVAGHLRLEAVAFDGPLRCGLDEIRRYRVAERLLTRRLRPLIGKPGQSSAPVGKLLNAEANTSARIVLNHATIADANHGVRIVPRSVCETP